jgi:hypothetical protein
MLVKDWCWHAQLGQCRFRAVFVVWALQSILGADGARPSERAEERTELSEVRQRRSLQRVLVDPKFFTEKNHSKYTYHDFSDYNEHVPVRIQKEIERVKEKDPFPENATTAVQELPPEKLKEIAKFEGKLARLFQTKMAANQGDLQKAAEQMALFHKALESGGQEALKGIDQYENNVHGVENTMALLNGTLDGLDAKRHRFGYEMLGLDESERLGSFDNWLNTHIREDDERRFKRPGHDPTAPIHRAQIPHGMQAHEEIQRGVERFDPWTDQRDTVEDGLHSSSSHHSSHHPLTASQDPLTESQKDFVMPEFDSQPVFNSHHFESHPMGDFEHHAI